jgi:hypothetical protein
MFFTIVICFIFGSIISLFVLSPFHIRFRVISLITLFILIATLLFSNVSFSKEVTDPESLIPPPFILKNSGNWLPSVNQYFITPLQGEISIHYIGMFLNSFHAKGTNLEIPIPKNFLKLKNIENNIIINFPLSEGVNQIEAEFILDASNGTAHWKPNTLQTLPGITLFMMSESNGLAFKNIPKDFNSRMNSSSRQLLRFGTTQSAFPQFEIVGILPKRNPLYVLVVFFTLLLLTTAFVTIRISRKQ